MGTTGYVSDDTCHWLSTQRLTFIDPGKRSRIVEMTRDDGLAIARKQVAVQSLIAAFRMVGTRKAKLDPLLWTSPHAPVELTPLFHGLSAADMSTRFSTADTLLFDEDATLRDIVTALEETYCGTLGAEFDGKDGATLRQATSSITRALAVSRRRATGRSMSCSHSIRHIWNSSTVFPMMGPGQSYPNMITGRFIPSRSRQEPGGKGTGRQAAADMFQPLFPCCQAEPLEPVGPGTSHIVQDSTQIKLLAEFTFPLPP
ncbi:hypothetical protein [Paraburkholderia gardini]|uniref:hypothetical protein n=1 Tax=Paraburkholderia gardini TaxID=2823469 RepID=UPI001D6F164B|nr:hypothetical protein [Paraburkholderia gardini]CAG4885740.1 hypothetical protein R69919_00065 [Paraburkholderia gardini]